MMTESKVDLAGVPSDMEAVAPSKCGKSPGSPPPPYNALFGQMKEAKRACEGPLSYATTPVRITIMGIGGCLVVLTGLFLFGLTFVLPVAEIVLGSMHLNDCSVNSNIPIFLIVSGVMGLLMGCCGGKTKKEKEGGEESCGEGACHGEERAHCSEEECGKNGEKVCAMVFKGCCSLIISTFLFAWMVTGSVWVFGARDTVQHIDTTSTETYCHEVLYKFAYYELIVKFATIAFILVAACIGCCVYGCIYCVVGEAVSMKRCSSGSTEKCINT